MRVLVRGTSDPHGLRGLPVAFVEGSLTDPGALERAVEAVDILFHVAADYRLGGANPHQVWAVTVEGTRRLLEEALKAGGHQIVYTSSGEMVRCSKIRLGTEEDFILPEACRSVYHRTKAIAG